MFGTQAIIFVECSSDMALVHSNSDHVYKSKFERHAFLILMICGHFFMSGRASHFISFCGILREQTRFLQFSNFRGLFTLLVFYN